MRSHSSVCVFRLSVLCLASFGDRQDPLFSVRNKADMLVQLECYLGLLGCFCNTPIHAAGGAGRACTGKASEGSAAADADGDGTTPRGPHNRHKKVFAVLFRLLAAGGAGRRRQWQGNDAGAAADADSDGTMRALYGRRTFSATRFQGDQACSITLQAAPAAGRSCRAPMATPQRTPTVTTCVAHTTRSVAPALRRRSPAARAPPGSTYLRVLRILMHTNSDGSPEVAHMRRATAQQPSDIGPEGSHPSWAAPSEVLAQCRMCCELMFR